MASGGNAFNSRERDTIEARPDISQGAPNSGKSVGMAVLTRPSIALVAPEASLMVRSRSSGSSTSVASVMVSMLTWLLADASPALRRLTGTAASNGLAGRLLCSRR